MLKALNSRVRRIVMAVGFGGGSLFMVPAMDNGCNATVDILIDGPATESEVYVEEQGMIEDDGWDQGWYDEWSYFPNW